MSKPKWISKNTRRPTREDGNNWGDVLVWNGCRAATVNWASDMWDYTHWTHYPDDPGFETPKSEVDAAFDDLMAKLRGKGVDRPLAWRIFKSGYALGKGEAK